MIPKIIGCIVAWCAEDFIGPSIEQALEYCDELFICVAPHSKAIAEFTDSTMSIARKMVRQTEKAKLVEWNETSFHAPTKANILNKMLSRSKMKKPGNWIWVLDVDEFYDKCAYNHIRRFINNTQHSHDLVEFQEYYFYINMQYYLKGSHLRLFKIKHPNNLFQPTQRWIYAENPIVLNCDYCSMFHYGMLTNPYAKIAFWKSEYPGQEQNNKTEWIDKVYRNYNVNNEYAWIEENRKLFGVASPWFSDSFTPQADGSLFRYTGFHPNFISKKLQRIKDFRVKYNFLPNQLKEGD